MAGLDRTIDPLTGDYVDAEGGEYEETRTIAPAVYHQLKTPRNGWWGDPERGSDLHLVRRRNLNRDTVLFAENAIRTALQPFIEQRLARDLVVKSETDARGRLTMESEITDIQGVQIDLTDIVGVGKE